MAAAAANAGDMPEDFRGIKWGQSPATLGAGATQIRSHRYDWGATRECYVRANELLKLGNAELKAIRYCFYNNQLDAVEIVADARYEASLLSVTTSAFGPPDPGRGSVWGWDNPIPGRSTAMLSTIAGEAQLVFVSTDSAMKSDGLKHRQQQARKQF
jgi:hypothetical protein